MPANPTLPALIADLVDHPPHGLWLLLAAITVLGALQLRVPRVSRSGLLTPLALGVCSLGSAGALSGAAGAVYWLTGALLAVLAGRTLRWPRVAIAADGRLALGAGAGPLAWRWAVFALRCAVVVSLALQPHSADERWAALGLAALYGALAGLFATRAWRVLQSARWALPAQAP